MINAEIYKFFNNKAIYLSFIIILIYSLFGNLLYYLSNIDISLMYKDFTNEYLILYLVVSLFYTSSAISDEYNYYIIPYIKQKGIVRSKVFCLLIIISITQIISFVFSNFITILIFKKSFFTTKIIYLIIKKLLNKLPLIIIINLLCLLFSSVFSKPSTSLIITYFVYGLSDYVNKFFLSKTWQITRYFPSLIWDLEIINKKINLSLCIVLILLYILILMLMIKLVIKLKKY